MFDEADDTGARAPLAVRAFRAWRASYSGLPVANWYLALAIWVNRSGSMVMLYLVLYLTQHGGYRPEEAGRFLSCYGVGAICGAFLGGVMCDRFGTARVLIATLAAYGLLLFALGAATQTATLVGVLFLLGVASDSVRAGIATCTATINAEATKTRAFALNRLAANFGITSGALLGGFLAEANYAWLFIVDGGTSLLAALILLIFLAPRAPLAVDAHAPAAAGADGRRSPFRDGIFVAMLLLTLPIAIFDFQMESTVPLYLKHVYGLRESNIGSLVAINTVTIVVLEMALVHRLERRAPLRIAAVGAFLAAAGFGLLPFGRGMATASLAIVVVTFGEMLFSPFAAGFVATRAGARSRGRYMGAFIQVYSVAYTVAPIVGTLLYERVAPAAMFVVMLCSAPLIGLGYFRLSRAVA